MIYYVKQGQSWRFQKIQIKQNECEISKICLRKRKIEQIVKKLKKKKIEQIVLSKELKRSEELIENLKNYDISVVDGKWLMQYMLEEIIDYLNKHNKILSVDEIAILVNDLTDIVRENIKRFANTYKKIRIITNHPERFKKLEQELYEEKGISIIFTNNKRKAISKSMLIINFDFVEEIINQYNINDNAIIINVASKIKINKKRFSGLIITDYEVELADICYEKIEDLYDILEKEKEFYLKEIAEEKIYTEFKKMANYKMFQAIKELINKYNFRIKELYGINGLIK